MTETTVEKPTSIFNSGRQQRPSHDEFLEDCMRVVVGSSKEGPLRGQSSVRMVERQTRGKVNTRANLPTTRTALATSR